MSLVCYYYTTPHYYFTSFKNKIKALTQIRWPFCFVESLLFTLKFVKMKVEFQFKDGKK